MLQFKITVASLCMVLISSTSFTQKVGIKNGGQTKSFQKKGSNNLNFAVNGNSFFFTTYTEQATPQYYLESFNASGEAVGQTKLEILGGVFNNSFSIDQVIGFGNKLYAMVEHMDKASGKNTLSAREIDNAGKVSTSETEMMFIPFEKVMNSGFHQCAVSPDQSTLAVLAEMPYVKDQSAKLKIALYDVSLKQTQNKEITLPGEDTKNKTISLVIANDGTVYLIKRTTTKIGEIALTTYQYSPSSNDLKEYKIEMTAPNQFNDYTHCLNANNELIISGTYYERKTVTVGEKMTTGVFFFTNKGKSESVFNSFKLDTPVENLTGRKLLVSGNTVFLTAEQFKEEKIAPPAAAAGTAASFDYNYNYTHKSEYVIGMDLEGARKFQLNMSKEFTARDFDKQYYAAYFICNDKLTVIYNDLTSKYTQNSGHSGVVPVLTQITNDGLMLSPIVFIDDLKLPYTFTVYPVYSVQQATNKVSMLMKNNDNSQLLQLTID